jgi:hypothetical protein
MAAELGFGGTAACAGLGSGGTAAYLPTTSLAPAFGLPFSNSTTWYTPAAQPDTSSRCR